jgi:hypothetical protein
MEESDKCMCGSRGEEDGGVVIGLNGVEWNGLKGIE